MVYIQLHAPSHIQEEQFKLCPCPGKQDQIHVLRGFAETVGALHVICGSGGGL